MINKELLKKYGEWRRLTEEGMESYGGTIDCRNPEVREDFSNYVNLESEITFEEIFALEKEYQELLDDYEITIEMLEEMGYCNTCQLDNINLELKSLAVLGYNCYFDRNTDRIVLDR